MVEAEQAAPPPAAHAKATVWVVLARAVSNIAAFVLMLLAARVLTPAQFGIFALVSAIAVLLIYVSEAGWEQYIISWSESAFPPPTVIVCALGCGVMAFLMGVLGAAGIHAYFHDPVSARLLVALSIPVVPAAFNAVQFATLVRNGNVARIAKINIGAELLGLGAGALSLRWGEGVFALAIAKNVFQFGVLTGAIIFARWLPRLEFNGAVAKKAIRYSWSVLQTKIVRFAYSYGADFMIGAFLGAADVGYYRAGSRIVSAITEGVGEPTRLVALSVLSREYRTRQSLSDFGASAVAITSIVIVLSAPIFVGLAIVSDTLVDVMLGPQWAITSWIVLLIALARLVGLPGMMTEPVFCVLGRPRVVTRTTIAFALTSFSCLAALAPFGVIWVGASVLVSAALFLPVTLWVNERLGSLPVKPVLINIRSAVLPLSAMAITTVVIGRTLGGHLPNWAILAAEVATGIGTYLAVLLIVRPAFLEPLRHDAGRYLSRRFS